MRLLIDTQLVIWTLAGSPRLRAKARALLRDPENECWVSAASVWEIAIKSAIGKLVMASPLRDLEKMLVADGFRILDVTMQHAATVPEIQLPHNDPFDRLLLAQCEVETMRLLSADQLLAKIPAVISV